MGDNRLLTLKEIARELGVNYRTLLGCKNRFSEYALGAFDGRNVRYPSEYIDFFQLVFALFDEGYTSNKIHNMLEHGVVSDEDMFVAGWIDEWRERLGVKSNSSNNPAKCWSLRQKDAGMSGCQDVGMDGRTDARMDGWTEGRMDGVIDGPIDGSMDGSMDGRMSGCPTGDPNGQTKEEQQREQPVDQAALLAQLKEELQDQLPSLVANQVQEEITRQLPQILTSLEDALLRLTSEINSSMTQLYKAIQEIQTAMRSLDSRLGRLEEDLGEGRSQEMSLEDLDLDELQVASPELEMDHDNPESLQHTEMESTEEKLPQQASMEFVRASVHNGRPNKQAVVHWIKAQKEQNPGLSYGELANRLNEAGIPTLSGRDEWSRGVVRNLAVRGNGG